MSTTEECPTCHRSANVGKDMVKLLDESGFLKELKADLSSKFVNLPTPEGTNIEQVIRDAVGSIKVEPTVKVVHHGLDELISCKDCAPQLKKYVASQIPKIKVAQSTTPRMNTVEKRGTFDW